MTDASLHVDVRFDRPAFTLDAAIDVAPGEVLAVLGPNGSGKSTLLDLVAGTLRPSAGEVRIGSRVLSGPGTRPVDPSRRRVGLLGQQGLVFPHLSALENVAFGPRSQGVRASAARAEARDRLDRVGLAQFERRRPAELSGGQLQRVALARTLAARPEVLLLDEPFAALDVEAASLMRRLVRTEGRALGIPTVLVTHDPLDAVVLADRAAVLEDGRVVDSGPVAQTLGHPRTTFAAALAGVNLVTGTWTGDGVRSAGGLVLHGTATEAGPPAAGARASAVFAPGDVHVRPAEEPDGSGGRPSAAAEPNHWTATVSAVEPVQGGVRIAVAEHPGLVVDVPTAAAVALDLEEGARIACSIPADDVSVRSPD